MGVPKPTAKCLQQVQKTASCREEAKELMSRIEVEKLVTWSAIKVVWFLRVCLDNVIYGFFPFLSFKGICRSIVHTSDPYCKTLSHA